LDHCTQDNNTLYYPTYVNIAKIIGGTE